MLQLIGADIACWCGCPERRIELAFNSVLEYWHMINLDDIQSLTDFKRHTAKFLKKMKRSKGPVVLTVNGRAEIVVQDARAYQEMLERVERAETVAALKQGIEEFERGEGRPARKALEELRRKHAISG
ncbi:MAG: type II toxin-antitoxin system Phd/YefM family antitoxin [Blastocatellia bacterium]